MWVMERILPLRIGPTRRARLPISFVINYEEGVELNILNGDSRSETFLVKIGNLPARENDRHPFSESIFEYGARLWYLAAVSFI